ncbi:hypothetical protein ACHAPE_010390 [Trichoderma viride]
MVNGFMNELELIKMLSATDTSLIEIEFSYIQSYIQEGAFHHELWDTESLPAAQDKAQPRRGTHSGGSSMPSESEAALSSSQQYPYRSNIAHPIAQLTSESANTLHLIDEIAAKVETCLKSPFAALNSNNAIVNGFALKLKRLSSAYRSKLQSTNAGLFPSLGSTEPMVDCLKDGNLRPARPVQIDQLETNKPLDGRQTENIQERTADAQSHFWTLPEEAQAFDFDEREWESILASFTLPV